MSPADAFDAFHRESHARLLRQVYAYAGTADVAHRALDGAYASAAQRWRSLAEDPGRDSWVRARAFRTASRFCDGRPDAERITARHTADPDQMLLRALASLPPGDRHLVVARYLADLDLPAAAQESGITGGSARRSLHAARERLRVAGVDSDPVKLTMALSRLGGDLPAPPDGEAARLWHAGTSRRRSLQLLAGAVTLVVAVGVPILTAAETRDPRAAGSLAASARSGSPTTVAPPRVGRAELATVQTVATADPERVWRSTSTSADFGASRLPHRCLSSPTQETAQHYWVKSFSTRSPNAPTTVTQTLEVDPTSRAARAAYEAQRTAYASCGNGSKVVAVRDLQGAGDAASLVTLEWVDGRGVQREQVAVGRSGRAVTTLLVQAPAQRSPRTARLARLLGKSVDRLCSDAGGTCTGPQYRTSSRVPPPEPTAPGFLSTVDLPLFEGLSEPWVSTRPAATSQNPAATECDQADFSAAGAAPVRTRSFVVPSERRLPDVFGITETVGTFASVDKASAFVHGVTAAVSTCSDGRATLAVPSNRKVELSPGRAGLWQIDLRTSATRSLIFRVAFVRVGSRVAEVTFTPNAGHDVDAAGLRALAARTAQRLTQL